MMTCPLAFYSPFSHPPVVIDVGSWMEVGRVELELELRARAACVLAGNCLPAGRAAAIIAYFAALTFHLKLLSDNRIAGRL